MSWGRKSVISVPYLWLTLFFLVPFVIVFKISFSEMDYAIPPYTDLFTWADEQLTLTLNLGNYAYLFTDDLYIRAYLSSIRIAAIATIICLFVAYPIFAREEAHRLLQKGRYHWPCKMDAWQSQVWQ